MAISGLILIGSTSEPGEVVPELRARMTIMKLEEYSTEDLRTIIPPEAADSFLELTDESIDYVAKSSGGSLRLNKQILMVVASSCFYDERVTGGSASGRSGKQVIFIDKDSDEWLVDVTEVPDDLVEEALDLLGLDFAGLDELGRTILATLAKHSRAPAEVIASKLGVDLVFTVEQLLGLLARGLLSTQDGCRWRLTESGRELAHFLGLTA